MRMHCICIALAAIFFLGLPPGDAAPPGRDDDVYKTLDILCDVITIIQRDYIDPIGSEKLIRDALKGMLSSLDDYSHLVPAPGPQPSPRAEDAVRDLGTYGLEVAYAGRLLTVVSPVEGGPAWKSGLRSGDVILKINEEPIEERPLVELLSLFRNGTSKELKLQVVRRGERDFLTFTLVPGKIEGPAVRMETLEDRIGLLRVARFENATASQAADCLKKLREGSIEGLIVDLRDCPSGDFGAAIAVADMFLPPGKPIASLKGRAEGASRDFTSHGEPLFTGGPLVLLINGGTSGAAELLAGALRAERGGLLMGRKSFGCAFEEGSFTLKDGSMLRMITAVYQTPDGHKIQDEGLDVDIEIPLPAPEEEEAAKPDMKKRTEPEEKPIDPMVRRAIDLIKGIRIMNLQERA